MTITPAKQAYTLADTITLAIDVPTTLKNRINGREETILEFDVGYELLIERIDSSFGDKIFTDDTYDNINMVSRSNEGTDKFAPRSIYFAPQLKKDTIYSASFSFVFTQPGVYSMKVNDYTDEDFFYMGENIRDNIIIENQCDKRAPFITLFSPVNNAADNNLSVLCEHRPEICDLNNLPEKRENGFDRGGGYIFDVVE